MGRKTKETKLIFLLDTYTLIKFFKEEKGAEKIRAIINKIEKGEIKGLISTITSAELFYILSRHKNIEFAKALLKYIKLSEIKPVDVSEEIAELGGAFKFKYSSGGLPLADALIAATAAIQNATVISDDAHFKKIKEVKVRNISEI